MPFVVTVVVGASNCGGSVGDPCPEAPPAEGDACNRASAAECHYGDCYGSPTTTAACRDEEWVLYQTSCNPPPPPNTTCPDEPPADGAWCNYEGDPCTFDCFQLGGGTATCTNSAWKVQPGICNPPPPPDTTCPDAPPEQGAWCNYEGDPCTFEFGGGSANCTPTEIAECVNQAWTILYGDCILPEVGYGDAGPDGGDAGPDAQPSVDGGTE